MVMKTALQVILFLSAAVLAMAKLPHEMGPSSKNEPLYASYMRNPYKYLSHSPGKIAINNKAWERAVFYDVRKWAKWTMASGYLPKERQIRRSIRLYPASDDTGGADLAFLSINNTPNALSISQSAWHICFHWQNLELPTNPTSEQVYDTLEGILECYIRKDILKEVKIGYIENQDGIWSYEELCSSSVYINAATKEAGLLIFKYSLVQPGTSPSVCALQDWFKVTKTKVDNGSIDMADLPRLSSEAEMRRYFASHPKWNKSN